VEIVRRNRSIIDMTINIISASGARITHGRDIEVPIKFWSEKLKGKGHVGEENRVGNINADVYRTLIF
jgi:hypothetical protein